MQTQNKKANGGLETQPKMTNRGSETQPKMTIITDDWQKAVEGYQTVTKEKTEKEKIEDVLQQILQDDYTENVVDYSKDFYDKEIEPIAWLTDNWWPAGDQTDNKTLNLLGASGVGKTTLYSYLMLCLSCNVPMFGNKDFSNHNPEKRPIVMICLEDGAKRMRTLLKSQWQSMVKSGLIASDNVPDIRYIYEERLLQRTKDGLYFEFLPTIFRLYDKPPVMVVCDSLLELNAIFGTAGNDSTSVSQALHPFRALNKEFGCNTLMINHPQKNSSIYQDEQQQIIGAAAGITSSKAIMKLQKGKTEGLLEFSFVKSTYMPEKFRTKKFVIRRNDDSTFTFMEMKEKNTSDQDEETQINYLQTLTYAKDLYYNQKIGTWKVVANKLNDEGKKNPSGEDWTADYISKEVRRLTKSADKVATLTDKKTNQTNKKTNQTSKKTKPTD